MLRYINKIAACFDTNFNLFIIMITSPGQVFHHSVCVKQSLKKGASFQKKKIVQKGSRVIEPKQNLKVFFLLFKKTPKNSKLF